MEIMCKEGVGTHEYEIAFRKFKENPEIYEKPEYEVRNYLLRIPYNAVLYFKILEKGDVQIDKKEIKIVTSFGEFYCDYKKEIHNYLKDVITKIEKQIEDSLQEKDLNENADE